MSILIETRLNALKLNESKGPRKGCLGRLEGICADFNNPTRNGRLYTRKLWENVFSNPIFKESLESKTLLGELDHPEDRFEALAGEACVVMTDYRFDDDNGVIYGGFDILDTPRGRILKALLDYGCVLGVSSRGQGDINESADGEIVDEDTYEFACFDVVTTPAVKTARQNVVESVCKTRKFTESIHSQIESAGTIDDLNAIQKVVKTTNLPEVDSIMESINNKRNALIEGRTTSSVMNSELQDAKKQIADLQEQLANYSSAKTISENKELYSCINQLRQQVSAYKHRERRLMESIVSRDQQIKSLQASEKTSSRSNNSLKSANESLVNENRSLNRKIANMNEQINKRSRKAVEDSRSIHLAESKLQRFANMLDEKDHTISEQLDTISSLENNISDLRKQLTVLESMNDETVTQSEKTMSELETEIDTYTGITDSLKNELTEARKQLQQATAQNAKLTEKCNNLSQTLNSYQESYVTSKSKQCGVDPAHIRKHLSESVSVQRVNNLIEEVQRTKDRYAKLPISDGTAFGVTINSSDLRAPEETTEYKRIESIVSQIAGSM